MDSTNKQSAEKRWTYFNTHDGKHALCLRCRRVPGSKIHVGGECSIKMIDIDENGVATCSMHQPMSIDAESLV